MRRQFRSMRCIRWCATFQETVRHAHLNGHRICTPVLIGSIDHWLDVKAQPKRRCTACRMRLANALRPGGST